MGGSVLQAVFDQWHYITSCLWVDGIILQAVFGWVALYYKLFLDGWHCITNLSLGLWYFITSCFWMGDTVLQTCLCVGGIVLQVVFGQWHCITNLSLGGWHC